MSKPLGPLPTRGLAREELSPARRAALDALIELGGRRTVVELAEALNQHPNTVREHLEALVRVGLADRSLRHQPGRGRPAALFRATLAATPAGPEYAVLAEVLINYLARTIPDEETRVAHALAAGRDWGRAIRERHLVDVPKAERLAAAGVTEPAPAVGEESAGCADRNSAVGDMSGAGTRATAAGADRNSAVGDEGVVAAGADGNSAVAAGGEVTAAAEDLEDSVGRLGEMLDRAGFDCRTTQEPDGGYTQRLRRCPVLELAREHPEVVCTSHLGMAQEILGRDGVSPDRVSLEAFAEPGACLLRIAPPAAADE